MILKKVVFLILRIIKNLYFIILYSSFSFFLTISFDISIKIMRKISRLRFFSDYYKTPQIFNTFFKNCLKKSIALYIINKNSGKNPKLHIKIYKRNQTFKFHAKVKYANTLYK